MSYSPWTVVFTVICGFTITSIAASDLYDIFCRPGTTLSKTECFLEEDRRVTRAFTYEVRRAPDGYSPTLTDYCDVDWKRGAIVFYPGCKLGHLPDSTSYHSYVQRSDEDRIVGDDRRRPFRRVDKVPKMTIKSDAKSRGLRYTSASPRATLDVSKKGKLTWGKNGRPIGEAAWLKKEGHRHTATSPYFVLPDGPGGFFIPGHAVVLGSTITVLRRTDPGLRFPDDARDLDSPTSSDDEPPPSYEEAMRMPPSLGLSRLQVRNGIPALETDV
ncbi:hypothetical protein FOZ61_002594 [Perkinsus olseni]|uniref:Uncharacterized protein n=1 Tax=Perkinsus olseni TaxID=32597 RepID=A0A7J6LSQ4_PEROL|nr:hypothetical protein FOZ61_002594 [Perkinsus olseni]KAF4667781.1 hypothetical protein FOL46_002352 [Perkinsus olseni]